jgi:GNAT superfamily N-acetyltransferase
MPDLFDSLPAQPHFRWIPIRSLSARHRSRVLTHLMTLEAHDRYLRFGYAANDAQVARYVDTLDFERDEIFGIFNRKLELIAMAHLAYLPGRPAKAEAAEFGVSVVPKARGKGLGARLFDHAVLHARNSDVDTMIIHALSENTAMLKIVHQAGASVVRDGSDAEARLKLPPYTVASQVEALVEDRAAELDYHIKRQARRVDALLGMLGDVRQGLEKTRQSGIE